MDEHAIQRLLRSLRLQSVRLTGRLLSVHASGQFALALDDGTEVQGMMPDGLPVEYLARFLGGAR